LEAELTTHYVKDKISATTGSASVANEAKRAYKHRMLLQKVNSVMRHGLLKAIRGKTLLSHLENKDYVTAEIENLDAIAPTQATRLVSLTCVRLIIDIFTVMAKRGGSGNSSFQDLCALPNPSKDSWPSLEKRLLEAKSHLLALRPANPEAVTDFMIAMQLHTFLKEGTKIRDDKYREAFRLILDDVEQELDAPGQFGPLSLAKMKEFGDKLQVTLQSSCLSEVPPSPQSTSWPTCKARLRKLESGGGGKPPDKPPPNKPAPAAVVPPRGGGRGRGRGSGGRGARTGRQEPTAPTGKCFVCGQVGCKPSTCPKGNPDAQKEHAERKAERERANMQKQVRRLQGAVDVSVDEVVSDEENAEQCLLPPNVSSNLPLSNPELSPEVFPKFLGTVCYDLSHDSETPTVHACIAVAPVLPPYLRPGLAKHGDWVVHIYKTQCRILPDCNSEKGPVVDTGAQRGAAKHASEIVARTGNSHNMIGALGDAKILPGIIMGCETIDANGRPFTLIVPDESVSDPTLTDSLIPVGRLKEDGFDVSFRIPVEAHIDGVDLAVYPKYGGKIITPKPDSRTIFMEYEDETWRLPKPTVSLRRVLPNYACRSCDTQYFSAIAEQQAGNEQSDHVRNSTRNEEDQRKFELMCRRQKEAAILHESYGHRNPTSLVKDLKAAGIPIKHLQRYLHAHSVNTVKRISDELLITANLLSSQGEMN
jgi:hypothetical protein